MQKLLLIVLGAGLAIGPAASAWADVLVVTDTTHKSLVLVSGDDGSLINSNYLSMSAQGCGNPITAKIVSPDEFWVTDKSNDQVLRYSLASNAYLGVITNTNISTPSGMEMVNGTVYVASVSAKKVVMINALTHAVTGSFATGSSLTGIPYDVEAFNGGGKSMQLLIDDYSPAHDIDVFSLAGSYLKTFFDSNGSTSFNSPQQVAVESNSYVLVAGSVSPRGIYEFDPNGAQMNYWSLSTSIRGVHELRNGNILYTDSSGIHMLNRTTGGTTDVLTGISANYIEMWVPEPGSLLLLSVAGLAALRRR